MAQNLKRILLVGLPCGLLFFYCMSITDALRKIFLGDDNSGLTYMKYIPMKLVVSQDMTRPVASLGTPICKRHVATVAYLALSSAKRHGIHEIKAKILMTGRDDGYLGFPGGVVSPTDSNILKGLHRELYEEMGLMHHPYLFPNESHYLVSHIHPDSGICVHLFSFELPMKYFNVLLQTLPSAPRFQEESFGYIFPPLFTMSEQESGADGLPIFLTLRFVGNTLQQLHDVILHHHLLSEVEWETALRLAQKSRHFHGITLAHADD